MLPHVASCCSCKICCATGKGHSGSGPSLHEAAQCRQHLYTHGRGAHVLLTLGLGIARSRCRGGTGSGWCHLVQASSTQVWRSACTSAVHICPFSTPILTLSLVCNLRTCSANTVQAAHEYIADDGCRKLLIITSPAAHAERVHLMKGSAACLAVLLGLHLG